MRGGARAGAGKKRKTYRAKRQRLTLSLDEIVCQRLAAEATRQGVSASELANRLLSGQLLSQEDYLKWLMGWDLFMPALDPFGFVGLADLAAIKRRYRELCKTHHPDAGGEAESFRKLTQAYEMALARQPRREDEPYAV